MACLSLASTRLSAKGKPFFRLMMSDPVSPRHGGAGLMHCSEKETAYAEEKDFRPAP